MLHKNRARRLRIPQPTSPSPRYARVPSLSPHFVGGERALEAVRRGRCAALKYARHSMDRGSTADAVDRRRRRWHVHRPPLFDTESGRSAIHKVSTTPDDPSRGILQGHRRALRRQRHRAADDRLVFHGTTIATNAVLEHEGARTGMITTEGFRDIVHIGRHQRSQHYSIMQDIPWQNRPLVKRRHRKVVSERLVPPTRRGARAARRGRGARGRARAEGRGRRGGRRLLPVLLPQSGARGARARRSSREEMPGGVRHDLVVASRRSSASSSASPPRR